MRCFRRFTLMLILLVLTLTTFACGESNPENLNNNNNGIIQTKICFLSGEDIIQEEVLVEDTLVNPVPPELDNKRFDGWYFDAEFSMPFDITKVSDHVIDNVVSVYARYVAIIPDIPKITLTFMTGTTEYHVETFDKGSPFSMPDEPTLDGYTFVGWYKDSDFLSPFNYVNEQTKGITEDTTIYAKFEENTAKLRLYLNGELYDTLTIKLSEKCVMPPNPVIDNMIFLHWIDKSTGDVFSIDKYYDTKELKDVDLDAVFVDEKVTITLMNDGNIMKTIPLKYKDTLILPTMERTLSHEFVYWMDGDKKFDLDSYNNDIFHESITLTAKWAERKNTLNFYSNDVLYKTINVSGINDFVMPENPTKDGYVFDHWYYKNETETILFDKAEYLNDINRKDMNMYAYFNKIRAQFNYVIDGEIINSQTIIGDDKLIQIDNPYFEHRMFLEWQINGVKLDVKAINKRLADEPDIDMGTVNINAKFAKTKVQFIDPNGFDEYCLIEYDDKSQFTMPNPPKEQGKTFEGWYYDDLLTKKFDYDAYIANNNYDDIALFPNMI